MICFVTFNAATIRLVEPTTGQCEASTQCSMHFRSGQEKELSICVSESKGLFSAEFMNEENQQHSEINAVFFPPVNAYNVMTA